MAIGEHISTDKRITALENAVTALAHDVRKLIICENNRISPLNSCSSDSRKGQI